jgi:hypothetical protein
MNRSIVEWSNKTIHPIKQRVRNRRWWLKVGTWFVLIYTVLTSLLFVAMKQTPVRFAGVMAKLPEISMMVFPFEPLWNIARRGKLRVANWPPIFDCNPTRSPPGCNCPAFGVTARSFSFSAVIPDRLFAGRFPRSISCMRSTKTEWPSTSFISRRLTPATFGRCLATSVTK